MSNKIKFGRACEDFVAHLIEEKTGYNVFNLNDIKNNYPTTDLAVKGIQNKTKYEISVKAKKSPTWPAVRGINEQSQYIIFVDIYKLESPQFYILDNKEWQKVLKNIKPDRADGSEIIKGALEWNWVADGVKKKYRGSALKVSDIAQYLNNWDILPKRPTT